MQYANFFLDVSKGVISSCPQGAGKGKNICPCYYDVVLTFVGEV